MSSHARHRASGDPDGAAAGGAESGGGSPRDALQDGAEAPPLDDAEQTAKDRSYSPSSDRETEVQQQQSSGDEALRPGTGGPDDSGDLPAPDDLDLSTIIERSEGGRRPGEG